MEIEASIAERPDAYHGYQTGPRGRMAHASVGRVAALTHIGRENRLMIIAAGIELPEAEIADICRRHQVRELSLFGSAARGEMRPDSDIDLLVDFLPGARPGLLGVSAMMRELAALLGRRVDLAVKPALKPLIRPGVLAEARLIYAA